MDQQLVNEEKRLQREEAVSYAYASVSLEGFVISPDEISHAQRYINGEITLSEFLSSSAYL